MKKKAIKPISVVAYLHANNCNSDKAYAIEKTQSRFLAQYAKSHNLQIEVELCGNGMGQMTVNSHFDQMISLISKGLVDGILVVNMQCLAKDYSQALAKIDRAILAGGYIYSAEDGGRLGSKIKSFEVKKNENN